MIKYLAFSVVVFIFAAQNSVAACEYCTDEILLNQKLAECFASRADSELAKLKASRLPATMVNLGSCSETKSPSRGGQAVPGAGSESRPLNFTFLLDEDGLRCLAAFVRNSKVKWTPNALFRRNVECAPRDN